MEAQAPPIEAPSPADLAPCVPRSMRVDPTGRIVLPEVPDDLLRRWREDRAALQAATVEAVARHTVEVRALAARIGELRSLVGDGYAVATDLRGLVYLFEKAVVDDGTECELTTASHIVIDCIRTMATRLEALDARADATREAGGAA